MGDMLTNSFPRQQLSYKSKTKAWRKKVVDFADSKSYTNFSPVRNTVKKKKIAYDLVNGILHMEDLQLLVNPDNLDAGYIPEKIQHYPIINSKLNVLIGEESARVFDFRVVVTNPNALSEIENTKKTELQQKLQEWVSNTAQSEEDAQEELNKIGDFFTYEWQDSREIRCNQLLNHYMKELDMANIFNQGFNDALIVGEEIYQCDIVGGEPTLTRLNPLKVRVFKSGFSNKIEDADMIVIEDYWSPGKIIDTYYDLLSSKDMKYIEQLPFSPNEGTVDSMGNIDERAAFVSSHMIGKSFEDGFYSDLFSDNQYNDSSLPYDMHGNIKVLKVYWKSRRKIKKVKSFDPQTGEEKFDFYKEDYIIDEYAGEEETIYWVNQAWEGVKIGSDIYINMGPRAIQYNSLNNPSKCHFGIVGTIYNINEDKPFSLVDTMKPYNYLYDVIHDRLNKLIARSWGSILRLDFSKMPKGWKIDKWLYYAKTMGLSVEDSFNEGQYGAALGKVAGAMNNASSGVISATDGNAIQQYMNLLEWIKNEMAEVAGISKQREGQVSNRETVGGVERATLQSSHITERFFTRHENLKKRVLECFIETAKIALKGRNLKFEYILSDNSRRVAEIDGDEFAECDYGLVVDNSQGIQELNQKLDMLAQAALQNQAIDFSTIMKLYTTTSMAEKQRMVERNEQQLKEMQQQQQQQQLQLQQQQMEQAAQTAQIQMEQQYQINKENNETKIQVAIINGEAEAQRFAMMNNDAENEVMAEAEKAKLQQSIKEFDAKLKLDRDKFEFEKQKHREDNALKDTISKRQLAKASKSSTK